jgi:hypothetical protein
VLVDCTSRDGRQMLDAGRKRIWFFSLPSIGRRQGKIYLNIPAFSVLGKSRSISVLQKYLATMIQNISESYVTCSVVWKNKLGVICTKMLQIQRKICFKVNNFFL